MKRAPLTMRVMHLAAGILLLAAFNANALTLSHLRLLRSEPAADSAVATSPRELRLWFSQRPELAMTSARISQGNHQVATGAAAIRQSEGEGVLVVLPVQSTLANGRHVVSWRTMAQDGHVITGEFAFTVEGKGGR